VLAVSFKSSLLLNRSPELSCLLSAFLPKKDKKCAFLLKKWLDVVEPHYHRNQFSPNFAKMCSRHKLVGADKKSA